MGLQGPHPGGVAGGGRGGWPGFARSAIPAGTGARRRSARRPARRTRPAPGRARRRAATRRQPGPAGSPPASPQSTPRRRRGPGTPAPPAASPAPAPDQPPADPPAPARSGLNRRHQARRRRDRQAAGCWPDPRTRRLRSPLPPTRWRPGGAGARTSPSGRASPGLRAGWRAQPGENRRRAPRRQRRGRHAERRGWPSQDRSRLASLRLADRTLTHSLTCSIIVPPTDSF